MKLNLPLILTVLSLSYPLMAQTINNRENSGDMIVQNSDRTEAEILSKEGMDLFRQGTLISKKQAIEKWQKALKLWRQIGDKNQQAWVLLSLGFTSNSLGEKQIALTYLTESLTLFQQIGDKQQQAVVLNNFGFINDTLGEKQKAIDYYNQALSLFSEIGDKGGESSIFNNLGFIYAQLGEYQKALDYYQKSLEITRNVLKDKRYEAITLNNIAGIYNNLNQQKKALNYYQQSLVLIQEIGDKKYEAITLHNLGMLYNDLGQKNTGINYLNQSLEINILTGDKKSESTILNNLGFIYYQLGENGKSLDYFNKSLILSQSLEYKAQEAKSLYYMALLERKKSNYETALNHINKVITIVENLRVKINDSDLRASYFATVQDYYKLKIDILMKLHQKDNNKGYNQEALNTNESSKARSLLELLTESRADIRQGIAPELLTKEKTLLQQINNKEGERIRLVSGNYTKAQLEKVKQELQSLLTQYQQLKSEIKTKNPRYAALTQPQPLTVKEIQQQVLDKDTVLLEYSLGKEKSYIWLVSQDKISSYELPSEKEIEAKVKEFRLQITDGSTSIKNVQTKSLPLSQIILAPVMNQIGNKRLLIVADGSLQYIPFNALHNPNETTKYSPLILTNEIITLPSASTVISLRENKPLKTAKSKQIAVIADPVFAQDDDRFKLQKIPNKKLNDNIQKLALNRAVGSTSIQLDRLKATRKEAEEIKKLIPEKEQIQVLDFAANLNFVKSHNLADYKIIHFATHGLIDPENPELSGLVLSLFDNLGNAENGFLRLNDIFNLKLNADLVVLSACQTGLGKQVKGEGLVGLTRGFMYAGTPRVVVSLWSVDDQGTSVLMSRFYELMLKKKMPVSSALRQAQIEMLQKGDYQLPYFWAAFTMQGEWK